MTIPTRKKVSEPLHAPSEPTEVAEPAPGTKGKRCEVCDARFAPAGTEMTCVTCTEKAKVQPGRVRCLVKHPGEVIAHGFVDGQLKTSFKDGDRADFLKADADSLPDFLIPI